MLWAVEALVDMEGARHSAHCNSSAGDNHQPQTPRLIWDALNWYLLELFTLVNILYLLRRTTSLTL